MKKLANILLAAYLILAGLILLGVSFPLIGTITGVVALVAGILFLLVRK
jgi:hypothetical protein